MKIIVIAASVLSLGLGSAAFAQSSSGSSGTTDGTSTTSGSTTGGSATGQTGMPSGWDSTLSGAFFSDASGSSLLSKDQIRQNWSSLTSEQQAQVKSDCSNMTASSSTGTSGTSGTSGSAASTDTTTTSSTGTATGAGMNSNMSELCSYIQGM